MPAGPTCKIGASSMDQANCEFASPTNTRTLVLVGRTGNGKSATGNSILGRRAFRTSHSSSHVTDTCQLQSTILRDGQKVNVIDTPGLFDFSVGSGFVEQEIMKFTDLAKNGIHVVVIVFSARTRFSQEEEAALHSLQTLSGEKIVNYMIVVFTGGDEFEENEETLEDYLGPQCPQPLKDIIARCGKRHLLFDNKTNNETKRVKQVQELLSLINLVVAQNGGQPYKDELFVELKKGAKRLQDQQCKREWAISSTMETINMVQQIAENVKELARWAFMIIENDKNRKCYEELERSRRLESNSIDSLRERENDLEKLRNKDSMAEVSDEVFYTEMFPETVITAQSWEEVQELNLKDKEEVIRINQCLQQMVVKLIDEQAVTVPYVAAYLKVKDTLDRSLDYCFPSCAIL